MKLVELKLGESAVIDRIDGNEDFVNRFLDFGIESGRTIKFIKKAPFLDPLLYEIGNLRVGIRKVDGKKIEVKRERNYSVNR
jgi:ferrous iron transport protein B